MLHLTITGQPITKKNSQRLVMVKGRPVPIPSSQYKKYESAALKELALQYDGAPIDYPVNVGCVYYVDTRRRVDLCNLLEATLDILTAAHVLTDDCCTVVVSHNDCRVAYDKTNPRVEISISQTDYCPWQIN